MEHKLEISSSHRRFRFLKRERHPQYLLTTLGLTVGISLFSGCGLYREPEVRSDEMGTEVDLENEVPTEEESSLETVWEEPSHLTDPASEIFFRDVAMERSVRNQLGFVSGEPVTLGDLQELEGLVLIDVDEDVTPINDCSHLKSLLFYNCSCDFSTLKELPELKKLSLWSVDLDLDFLKQYPQLEELSLWGVAVDNLDFLNDFPHLKKLTLSDCNYLKKLPIEKLKTLEVLSFENNVDQTSMLHYLTYQDICELEEAGVVIDTEIPFSHFKELAFQLDQIVRELPVSTDSTDQEKLDAVLIYVLEHLTYDYEALQGSEDEVLEKLRAYNFHTLEYALDENPNAVCCNYASLVEALSARVGLEAYSLRTPEHAWNLVQVEGDYYHVDATWLDSSHVETIHRNLGVPSSSRVPQVSSIDAAEAIREGLGDQLNWYMVPLANLTRLDPSHVHDEGAIPCFLTYRFVNEEEAEVKFNGKTLLISLGALFGLFAAIKIATPIVKAIHEERKNEQQKDKLWDLVDDYHRSSNRSRFGKK